MTRRVDVLVIGAGAAGLAAARDLSQAGLSAIVVEARERIGGRVWTVHDRNSPLPIELGAEFVHGEAPETFVIIRAARLIVDELPDIHHRSGNGKLAPVRDFWGQVDEIRKDMAKKLKRKTGGDLSVGQFLERANLPSGQRGMFTNFVEGYHAAPVHKISARSIAAGDEETDDESSSKQFRIVGGYDDVLHWLRAGPDPERVEVRLNTVATEVRWKRGNVVLKCTNRAGAALQPFHATAALITIPHAVLKAKALLIQPELKERETASAGLEVGQVFKIVLRFRRAFWEDSVNFVHAEDADVPVWWTALPARVPLITGWAGGPQAEVLLNEAGESRVERSLDALSKVLAAPRRVIDDLLDGWSMHDWRADPFSRGAYVYVGVGGNAAQKALAKPVEGTLFFAGEATAAEQTGTVAGAIASGRRAAREVIGVLRSANRRVVPPGQPK